MTLADALAAASRTLEPVGGSGRLDAALLLEYVTGVRREAILGDGERALSATESEAFERCVAQRRAGMPVAYITGSVGFYGRSFAVDARVLIPRPETEHLVEAVLADVRARGKTAGRIADIGTGSGAIAITLACELPGTWVFGTDASRGAIAVARRNAARNTCFQECTFLQGDLAEPLGRFAPFDAIVANLPYVPTGAIPAAPDPVSFEPALALDGGADGLAVYRRLIAQLPAVLALDASVFLEAAPDTIDALAALVEATFPRAHVEIGNDYGGRARYVAFTLEAA